MKGTPKGSVTEGRLSKQVVAKGQDAVNASFEVDAEVFRMAFFLQARLTHKRPFRSSTTPLRKFKTRGVENEIPHLYFRNILIFRFPKH